MTEKVDISTWDALRAWIITTFGVTNDGGDALRFDLPHCTGTHNVLLLRVEDEPRAAWVCFALKVCASDKIPAAQLLEEAAFVRIGSFCFHRRFLVIQQKLPLDTLSTSNVRTLLDALAKERKSIIEKLAGDDQPTAPFSHFSE